MVASNAHSCHQAPASLLRDCPRLVQSAYPGGAVSSTEATAALTGLSACREARVPPLLDPGKWELGWTMFRQSA